MKLFVAFSFVVIRVLVFSLLAALCVVGGLAVGAACAAAGVVLAVGIVGYSVVRRL